jgi:DNA-binding phage protein
MPARDRLHDVVRVALERDGWVITADPLVLPVGLHNLYVDLAAERVLAAERGTDRIAVEVKGFTGRSEVADLEQALGQYVLYRALLERSDPTRKMILAVPRAPWLSLFESELGRAAREGVDVHAMVFDPGTMEVWRWAP